jgi:hypothetical protein
VTIPGLGPKLGELYASAKNRNFSDSAGYWEKRYATAGNSGAGSFGRLAQFKAEIVNQFVSEMGVQTILELGCGDGSQLSLARYPSYVGFDTSPTAIALCRRAFEQDPTKQFYVLHEVPIPPAEMGLSLDVLYHLVEDHVYESYLDDLFSHSDRWVVTYGTDSSRSGKLPGAPHIRHRPINADIEERFPDWQLVRYIPNKYPYNGDPRMTSFSNFCIYAKHFPSKANEKLKSA